MLLNSFTLFLLNKFPQAKYKKFVKKEKIKISINEKFYKKLSIIIPVYNEKKTINKILSKINKLDKIYKGTNSNESCRCF